MIASSIRISGALPTSSQQQLVACGQLASPCSPWASLLPIGLLDQHSHSPPSTSRIDLFLLLSQSARLGIEGFDCCSIEIESRQIKQAGRLLDSLKEAGVGYYQQLTTSNYQQLVATRLTTSRFGFVWKNEKRRRRKQKSNFPSTLLIISYDIHLIRSKSSRRQGKRLSFHLWVKKRKKIKKRSGM